MGGRGGSPNPGPQAPAAASNDTGFDTGDQELNELLDVYYDTPGYKIGLFDGFLEVNYEPDPSQSRDADDILTLRDARQGLARKYGWGREKQDREFVRLQRAGQIQMFPMAKRLAVTQAMRDASFRMGGEDKDALLLNKARQYKRTR
jgi:hypothetical protein